MSSPCIQKFPYTTYPCELDNTNPSADTLPLSVDNRTPVEAIVVNRHRNAILAIENELGINPSGTYLTVKARLDALEAGGGGGGGGGHDGYAPTQKTLTVIYYNQTVFTLGIQPSLPSATELFVNGIKYRYGVDYTLSGMTITWAGTPILLVTDIIDVIFFRAGTGAPVQETFIATPAQTLFYLGATSVLPYATEFFVNGIKNRFATDYNISGATVTYLGAPILIAGDIIDIIYYIASGSSGGSGAGTQTLAQTLALGNNANALSIVNMADPINPQDAATKAYVDAQITAHDSLSEVLSHGNTTDGYDIEMSSGTRIVGTAEITVDAADSVVGSGSNVAINAGSGIDGGEVNISGGTGSDRGGGAFVWGGAGIANDGGSVGILAGGSDSGEGGYAYVYGGDSVSSDGGWAFLRGGASTTGNGGWAYTWGGDSIDGNAGYAAVIGGVSTNLAGGWCGVIAGDGYTSGGSVNIWAGEGTNSNGGDVEILSGLGFNDGGDVTIDSGDGTAGNGGDIVLTTGDGPAGDGYIIFNRSGVEIARWNDIANIYTDLTVDGYALINNDLAVTGKLYVDGLIDPTGMVLTNQISVPGGNPDPGKVTLWTRDSDGYLVQTDSSGREIVIGPQTLAQILLGGNTTGASSIILDDTGGGSGEIAASGLSDLDIYTQNGIVPGDVNIWGGHATADYGGDVYIYGGSSVVSEGGWASVSGGSGLYGGPAKLIGGTGDEYGGDIEITSGTGLTENDGYIILSRGMTEVARWDEDESGAQRLLLNSYVIIDGYVSVENNTIRNIADPVDAQDAATKNYVDGYVTVNNEWREILANGNISGGTNPIISTGDELQGQTDLVLAANSGDIIFKRNGAEIARWMTGSEALIWEKTVEALISQTSPDSGSVTNPFTIKAANGASGAVPSSGGEIIVTAGTGGSHTSGIGREGGAITIGSGYGSAATLSGTMGGDGGIVSVFGRKGGDGFDESGGLGGSITLWAGDAGACGAGFSSTGGSITIITGAGTGDVPVDGYIKLQNGIGDLFVVGTDYISAENNIIHNITDPVEAQDAATKNYVDGYFSANNEWKEILTNGNVSGGTNPIISTGDELQGETNLTIVANSGNIILKTSNVDGYIIFKRGGIEIARWDDGGSDRLYLSGTEVVEFGATVVNPEIRQEMAIGSGGNNLIITAQAADYGLYNGGDLILGAGANGGSGIDGYIMLSRGATEVARWDEVSGNQRLLLNCQSLLIDKNVVAPVIGMETITNLGSPASLLTIQGQMSDGGFGGGGIDIVTGYSIDSDPTTGALRLYQGLNERLVFGAGTGSGDVTLSLYSAVGSGQNFYIAGDDAGTIFHCQDAGTGPQIGVFGAAATGQPTVSGARNNPEAALASLLTALNTLGWINNTTTAS